MKICDEYRPHVALKFSRGEVCKSRVSSDIVLVQSDYHDVNPGYMISCIRLTGKMAGERVLIYAENLIRYPNACIKLGDPE